MLCSVYTTIAGEYDGPGFCTPIGKRVRINDNDKIFFKVIYMDMSKNNMEIYSYRYTSY